jgi:hypothetical protein
MIADVVTSFRYPARDGGMIPYSFTNQEKGCPHIFALQDVEDSKRDLFIGSVIEGQSENRLVGLDMKHNIRIGSSQGSNEPPWLVEVRRSRRERGTKQPNECSDNPPPAAPKTAGGRHTREYRAEALSLLEQRPDGRNVRSCEVRFGSL